MASHIIADDNKLKAKLQLVQSLIDVQLANEITKRAPKKVKKVTEKSKEPSLVDQNYEKLNCEITPIEESAKDFAMIDQYIQNGKGGYKKLKIIDAFHIKREGEAEVYNPDKLNNKQLLWHGSRFSNFSGILS